MKKLITLWFTLALMSIGSQYISGATKCDCQRLYEISTGTKEGLRYGFINCHGKIIVEPMFVGTEEFSDGVVVVNLEKKVIRHKEDGHPIYEITDGIVDFDGRLVELPSTNILSSFSEGLALAKINDRLVYIDKKGKIVISIPDDLKISDVDYSPPEEYQFYNGVAGLRAEGGGIYLITRDGNITFHKESFYRYDESGLAIVDVEGQQAIVNREGNYIFGPQGNDIEGSEGLYIIVPNGTNKKHKFINSKGELLFEHSFDDVGLFREGLAKVKVNGKWGYLDKSGNLKIPIRFDDARDFTEGLAGVEVNGKWGFINKKGSFIILPKFKSVRDFECGIVYVQRNKGEGYINKSGSWVWKEINR